MGNAEDNGPVPILKSNVSFYSQQVLVRGPEEHHRALQDIVDKKTPWTLIKTNQHPDLDARLVNKVMAEALAGRRNPGLVCWSDQYTTTAEEKKTSLFACPSHFHPAHGSFACRDTHSRHESVCDFMVGRARNFTHKKHGDRCSVGSK